VFLPKERDPQRCFLVLFFLQEGLERHLSASTLKVYMAATLNHNNRDAR